MLQLHGITSRLFASITPTRTFGPGSLVEVETLCHGKQIAVIEEIGLSPFYGEETTYRARVGSLAGNPFFIDYLLIEELVPAEPDFELELEYDPDYAAFLHDIAATDFDN
jgi:hypothetical protein